MFSVWAAFLHHASPQSSCSPPWASIQANPWLPAALSSFSLPPGPSATPRPMNLGSAGHFCPVLAAGNFISQSGIIWEARLTFWTRENLLIKQLRILGSKHFMFEYTVAPDQPQHASVGIHTVSLQGHFLWFVSKECLIC